MCYFEPGNDAYGRTMRRREFITLLGGATVTWPVAARAQQSTIPVIGFLGGESPDLYADLLRALRQGLKETGFVEGQNLAIEYRWTEGHNDRPVGVCDRSGSSPGSRDRRGQHAGEPCCQGCNRGHSNRVFCGGRPGRAWTCRQPEPTRRQPHGYNQFNVGGCIEMA